MATLVLEVARHGVAHDAETEKSHFRHRFPPPIRGADAYMAQ
jgi:hypothetical protein